MNDGARRGQHQSVERARDRHHRAEHDHRVTPAGAGFGYRGFEREVRIFGRRVIIGRRGLRLEHRRPGDADRHAQRHRVLPLSRLRDLQVAAA